MLLRRLIGSALRRSRLRQGRTLREVAYTARVSMPYLSEVERGRKEVSSEILAAICLALGLQLGDLLDEIRGELSLPPARPGPTPPLAPRSPATPAARPASAPAAGRQPTAPAAPGRPGATHPVAPVAHSSRAPQASVRRPARSRHGLRTRRLVRHVEAAPALTTDLPGLRLAHFALAGSPAPAFRVTVGGRAGW